MARDSNEVPISKARENLAEVVSKVRYGGARYVLTRSNRRAAAIVSMEDLALLEAIDERLDEQWAVEGIERARREAGEPIPAEDVFRELGL
jgi:prevent-host-death family protein